MLNCVISEVDTAFLHILSWELKLKVKHCGNKIRLLQICSMELKWKFNGLISIFSSKLAIQFELTN